MKRLFCGTMLIIVLFAFVSCSIGQSSTLTTNATESSTFTTDKTDPTSEIDSSSTFKETDDLSPASLLKYQELKELQSSSRKGFNTSGSFVLISPYLASNFQVHLWNLGSSWKRELAPMGKAITSLSVSPDRKWLAYSEGDGQPGVDYAPDLEQLPPYWEGRSLVIVDGEAHEQQRIPFEQGWGLLSRWLTNETFLLRCARQNTSCPMYSARYVLYPFNKEVVELPEDPEDLSFFPNISDWHGQGLNSYDPTLSYRVYASDTGELILENIQSHKEVIRIITPLDIAPEWSPDGKQFVIALHPLSRPDSADLEFYGVKINGEMNQLTQLSALNIKLYPYNYSWAPDGKKVAFWISASIASDVNAVDFAVLDLSSNEVIVYSIRSTFKGPPMSVWSPMGDQVLIGTTNQMGESTFLLDFTENWFIQIAKDMVPVGWLVNDKK